MATNKPSVPLGTEGIRMITHDKVRTYKLYQKTKYDVELNT